VNYFLSDAATGETASETQAASDFAAIEWFRDWLARHAARDAYLLARDDGVELAHFVRTVADQWYAIARSRCAGAKS
jgi:hypothetical protein